MARAKRTDRAAARRRYRNEMTADQLADAPEDDEPSGDPTPARQSRSAPAAPNRPARVGIGTAFRQAIHPVDVRSDVKALPQLVRSKALWIPVLLTVASAAVVVATGTNEAVSQLLYTYFVQTPAIGGVFLAGFLAPRASWLLGVLVGLVSAAAFSILALSGRLNGALAPTPEQVQGAVTYAFLLSPVMGALFASGAAWYRRFLQLSNPNRAKLAEQKRAANARSRNGAQKAGARR